MNITRKWNKFFVVGCSHGNLIDPVAAEAVLKFKDKWKPKKTIHLGDFVDTAAFRSGSKGTSDESEPIGPDIDSGISFLQALRPNLVFNGNHEARLWRLLNHNNAIISDCAGQIVNRLQMAMTRLKAEYVENWSARSYRMIGNYKLMHGYMYGENATRDHAISHGNIIHAHTHRPAMSKPKRDDSVIGYCVGTLSNISSMDYAACRSSTLSWGGGFVWGEYSDDLTVCWLHEQPQSQKEWRLPG